MIDISKQKIQSNCPSCNHKFSVTLKQVANEEIIKCNSCKNDIQLKDSNGSSKKSIRDVNKSFKDLEKTLKNFGK